MRALILVHRWMGIAFCLLFAMWFATGIVMHFVAFPALTDEERLEGLGTPFSGKGELHFSRPLRTEADDEFRHPCGARWHLLIAASFRT